MLDVAWPELIVIGAVALIAIGPKDLPKVMYNLGKWAGKARRFGTEIQQVFEEMNYEAEAAERARTAAATPPKPATAEPSARKSDDKP